MQSIAPRRAMLCQTVRSGSWIGVPGRQTGVPQSRCAAVDARALSAVASFTALL